MRNLRRIPGSPAPKFFASLRVMPSQTIAANQEQLLASVKFVRHWRRKCLTRFGDRFTGPQLPPEHLPGGWIKRQEIRLIRSICSSATIDGHVALQDLHVKLAIVKHWARGKGPVKSKLAVLLLNVARPKLLSSQIIRHQITRREKEDYALPVSRRRGRGEVALLIAAISLRDVLLPHNLARGSINTKRHHFLLCLIAGRNEDAILPNCWRRCARSGQIHAPEHVFGLGEFGRQLLFRCRAIEIWPAPLAPVLREGRERKAEECTADNCFPFIHNSGE